MRAATDFFLIVLRICNIAAKGLLLCIEEAAGARGERFVPNGSYLLILLSSSFPHESVYAFMRLPSHEILQLQKELSAALSIELRIRVVRALEGVQVVRRSNVHRAERVDLVRHERVDLQSFREVIVLGDNTCKQPPSKLVVRSHPKDVSAEELFAGFAICES